MKKKKKKAEKSEDGFEDVEKKEKKKKKKKDKAKTLTGSNKSIIIMEKPKRDSEGKKMKEQEEAHGQRKRSETGSKKIDDEVLKKERRKTWMPGSQGLKKFTGKFSQKSSGSQIGRDLSSQNSGKKEKKIKKTKSKFVQTAESSSSSEESEDSEEEEEEDIFEPPLEKAARIIKETTTNCKYMIELSSLGLTNDTVPSGFQEMKNIVSVMDLSFNSFTTLPSDLKVFGNIKKLYLHGNRIEELTTLIGQLTTLQELNLNGNQITSLPPVIVSLPSNSPRSNESLIIVFH